MQPSHSTMTWVSAQMMRDRDRGEFENYGERLYVEGLLELERKKAVVRESSPVAQIRKWVLHVRLHAVLRHTIAVGNLPS